MSDWAAKVLAGVPRWTIDEGRGAFLSEAEVLDAIAKLADGGGLVDQATAALEGVTDGPWAVEYKDGTTRLLMGNEVAMCDEKYYPWTPENDKDWHFIAFTRQWVPEAADRIAALTAQNREMALDVLASSGQAQEAYAAQLAAEAERDYTHGTNEVLRAENQRIEAEAAALRAKVARIASAWPIVRDADCSGGTLASAMDEIEAAISDGAADE